ncbi:Bromodomain and PHD finger-containing protein 3 [Merluccius polli]|uniref:Bromodomain and PHD finger-containing protein 3 n=1 Tax=Merluccius polli TaxID=89951 RepID=A0AA47M1I2_MERPO|nr:Bromodomain and PHD finger-containing protein 3 [Merluccius polli]
MRKVRGGACETAVNRFTMGRGRGRGRGRGGRGSSGQFRPPSPYRLQLSPSRETLTYAQAQKIVEVDLDGRLHRINITDPLPVITEDEMMAQDLSECNSNKENSEQTQSKARSWRKPPNVKGRRNGKSVLTPTPINTPLNRSPFPEPVFRVLSAECPSDAPPLPAAYYRYIETSGEEREREAEYDMDEEDLAWLEMVNQKRVSDGHASVSPETFELLIDRLERESVLESRNQALSQSAVDEDAFCCVCLDDECLNSNVILFCDICNLAVHQECYGVPYVPEGHRPSRPMDCVLCPNRGGAFKQTSDGRWAHVVCAIWIPEVCFANTVFLEPVEGIKNIPAARWKLTCYLCKQKGRGASIQCHKANCYRAFHVTCAQKAGLFMKIDPVRETGANGTTFTVKKTAFCEHHSPLGARHNAAAAGDEAAAEERPAGGRGNRGQRSYTQSPPSPNKKNTPKGQKKKGKKGSGGPGRRAAVPVLLVPQIPSHRLNKICTGVAVQRKNQFMQRLHNYWLLKRQSKNGMPLIRRLHSHLQAHKTTELEPDEKLCAAREELRYWQKLRQDLERARLLIELIRKRERLKREQMKVQQATLELKLTPALVLLRSTLDQLQEKDSAKIFSQPVNLAEVPDYPEFISQPMDLSTMRAKLEAHAYRSVADLECDFDLMVSNCLKYNSKDTMFHKAALQLREVGGAVLRHAHRQAQSIGLDPSSGLHLPDSHNKHGFYQCSWDDIDSILDPENRLHLTTDEQLKTLLDKLDAVTSMRSSGGRTKRVRLLRREINTLRQRRNQQQLHSQAVSSNTKKDQTEEEEEEEEEEDREEEDKKAEVKKERKKGKKEIADNGPLTSASTPGADDSPPVLELTGPVSSPLPGDAPLEPPVLGMAPGGRRSPGRSYKRQRSARGGSKSHGEDEAEVGETACPQPEAVHEVTPLGRPAPAPPLAGVGRRTSVLFKKAKNGARQPGKNKAQMAESKANGLDGAGALSALLTYDHDHVRVRAALLSLPPPPEIQRA